mgnify:CR=1 FL=1
MSDQFVAEIRIFPFNFAPRGWAQCNGQLIPISQNTALFSLLGTTYGGNGTTNFALPNLMGRVPIQPGQGAGLAQRSLGEEIGQESVTLLQSEVPFHTHSLMGNATPSDTPRVENNTVARSAAGTSSFQTNTSANLVPMAAQTLPPAGGSLPHTNMMPYLVVNFCIAMQGIFPPRP